MREGKHGQLSQGKTLVRFLTSSLLRLVSQKKKFALIILEASVKSNKVRLSICLNHDF